MGKKIIQKAGRYFTETEKHQVIQEFISNQCSKQEIWEKYTGKNDHGVLLRWMRTLGYCSESSFNGLNLGTGYTPMTKKKTTSNKGEDDFEILQLKQRVALLEKQLKEAELKAIAFSTMVDIAEKEFNIPIRKKFNTKP